MAMPQEVTIFRAFGWYLPYFGLFWYVHKHGSCARRLEQHITVGFAPWMTAALQLASAAMLQSADAPPELTATTTARAISIATAFAMPCLLYIYLSPLSASEYMKVILRCCVGWWCMHPGMLWLGIYTQELTYQN